MLIIEKLSVLLEFINCNYDLYFWEYDEKLHFLHSDWPHDIFSGDFLFYTGLKKLVQEHLDANQKTPVILETAPNLLWLGGFYYEQNSLSKCFFIGPFYSGKDSPFLLRKYLNAYDLSVRLRSTLLKIFEQISTIPTTILSQYAVMLHYCLNHEKISLSELNYKSNAPAVTDDGYTAQSTRHANIWYFEQQLCKMFAEGDLRYKDALAKSFSISSGMQIELSDSLRQHKNNLLVLLTLCSRACISGGLPSSISYDLNDYYAKKIEDASNLTELIKLSNEMLEDYVGRVRQIKQQSHISAPIQLACEYIRTNLSQPLSIALLADKSGYSEYYFSHKFKKEVGVSVNDYILNERIELAKLRLAGTQASIQSLSDDLHFGNRSYFYSCFQKKVGMSPSQYRRKTQKI